MRWLIASLASSGISPLSLLLAPLVIAVACRIAQNRLANSVQELEAFMSTTRTASIQGFGGSQSKRAGVSPVLTARQKAFSAATRMVW